MKNKLSDLNNHLFAQLERLGEEGLKGDSLARELERTKGVTSIAKEIISNGRLVLDAQVKTVDVLPGRKSLPDTFS